MDYYLYKMDFIDFFYTDITQTSFIEQSDNVCFQFRHINTSFTLQFALDLLFIFESVVKKSSSKNILNFHIIHTRKTLVLT